MGGTESEWERQVLSDDELRLNHRFVVCFEGLRKRYGFREMKDAALHEIAGESGLAFEDLRRARHLRNAIAHGDPVNRESVERHLSMLCGGRSPTATARLTLSPTERHGYRIHAWLDTRLEQEMLANGFVSIGGKELGDLSHVEDDEEIRRQLTQEMPERSERAINIFVGYWRRFLWEAELGDLILLPTRDRTVSIGELAGPYRFVGHADAHARHRRPVSWAALGVPRESIGPDLLKVVSGRHTIQEIKNADAVNRLARIATDPTDLPPG